MCCCWLLVSIEHFSNRGVCSLIVFVLFVCCVCVLCYMFNIVVGIIGQTALVALPFYLVIKMNMHLAITAGIVIVCILIMKRTWWDKLEN